MVDSGKLYVTKKKSKKRKTEAPIQKLSSALKKYKDQKEKSEEQLCKVIEKVKLDKSILLREKLGSIWNDALY